MMYKKSLYKVECKIKFIYMQLISLRSSPRQTDQLSKLVVMILTDLYAYLFLNDFRYE